MIMPGDVVWIECKRKLGRCVELVFGKRGAPVARSNCVPHYLVEYTIDKLSGKRGRQVRQRLYHRDKLVELSADQLPEGIRHEREKYK